MEFKPPVLVSIAGILLVLSSCGMLETRDDLKELEENRDKWSAFKMSHYSFESRRACFCAPELNEWTTVEVLNDTIVSIVKVETGEPPEFLDSTQFDTMEEIFEWLENLIRDADEYSIEYDSEFGNPSSVQYDYYEDAVDDEGAMYTRNVSKLRD